MLFLLLWIGGLGACRAAPLEVVLFFPPRALDAAQQATEILGRNALPIFVAPVIDRRSRPEIIGELRSVGSLVTGRIRASNSGPKWVRGAARYELKRAGLRVLDDEELVEYGDSGPLLELELTLLSTRSAADEEHPGEVLLSAILRRDGGILMAKRLRGSACFRDDSGVRVDAAESLAIALRRALAPVVSRAVKAATEGRESSGSDHPAPRTGT